jgi:hypothetical protein
MKHLAAWLVAALCLPACSSGSNHDRGPLSNAGNGVGATGSSGSPGAGNSSQGGSTSNGGTGTNGGSGSPTGGANANGGSAQATGGTPSVGYSLNCPTPATGSPVLRLFTRNEFENTINDLFPAIKGQWTNSLPANAVSSAGFDNDASNKPGDQFVSALTETAESVASGIVGTGLANLLPCSTSAADHSCADTFVKKFGPRLFRRPLTQVEQDRYLTLFDTAKAASDFKTALKWITVGMIQSPNAVFRSEIGAVANGKRQLTPYEVATELAYTFTGSTPDEALLTKAASGNLGDLTALAKAMLATEAGKRVVQRFFDGYLEYPRVASISKINITSPSFDTISQDMVKETRAFVDDVVLQKGGGVRQLLTADTTNLSPSLATYYGFPAPSGDFASVKRPSGKGIGVLAQGAFLASHANPDASSPTQRGLFAYYRLLCQGKLQVPPNVPAIGKAVETKTTRQRYEEAHTATNDTCPGCHKRFDPIGFGFEHFDEAGRYRDMQNGEPINSVADVPGPDLKPIFSFATQEEMMTKFAEQPVTYQCFAAYLATYAFGTVESCLGASKASALQAGTIGIVDALAALASEPHFTQRKAQ